jgi:hypothetical protein
VRLNEPLLTQEPGRRCAVQWCRSVRSLTPR